MTPSNSKRRNFMLSSFIVGAVLLACSTSVSAQNRVLVIDEGVDLEHSSLAARKFVNAPEHTGQIAHDDDQNGFIDDVSGWNAVSSDAEYFPTWIRKMFSDNAATITKLLSLYDRVEAGDQDAIRTVRSNPSIGRAISSVLGLSHGTHVGGIVVRYGNPSAEVASLNVFTSSQEPANENNEAPSFARAHLSVDTSMNHFKRLVRESLSRPSSATRGAFSTLSVESRFDDTEGVTDFIARMRTKEMAEKRKLALYVAATKARVVNLSLGASKINIRRALDSMWEEELLEAKLPISTPRSEIQEANFQRMLNEVFEAFRSAWNDVFRSNPGVLFVIAAGNDADDSNVADAGNNGINEVLPANCSKDNLNVITVAATTPEGVIADFSNFHATLVNVAAWGTAVPSLAPNNNVVKMSGTSMASPNAAGLASRLFSVNPRLSPAQARRILEGTVKKIASLKGRISSEGIVDPQAALDAAAKMLLTNNVDAAIRAALNARNAPQSMPLLMTHSPFASTPSSDKTRVGQVHRTPDLIKQFMR